MKTAGHRIRLALSTAAILASLGLVACGDDDSSSTAPEGESVSSEQAIAEIAEVRSGLDDSLSAYTDGDAAAAEELAGDAYLEHFELVEGPLEEVDAELTEELEELIREQLREAINGGEPEKQVAALVAEADADLERAKTALQGAGG